MLIHTAILGLFIALVLILGLVGILGCRSRAYWTWGLIFLAWLVVWPFLFAVAGTLENPDGDGLVTGAIRIATQDGPSLAFVGLGSVAVFWSGVVAFLWGMVRAYRQYREQRAPEAQLDADGGVGVEVISPSSGRKAAEAATLCLGVAVLIYFYVAEYRARHATLDLAREMPQSGSRYGADGADPVARDLQAWAARETLTLPKDLDATTTFERVQVQGRTLIYSYRLSRPGGAALVASFRRSILSEDCADPNYRSWMDYHGVTFRYRYVFSDSPTPVTINVDAAACWEG